MCVFHSQIWKLFVWTRSYGLLQLLSVDLTLKEDIEYFQCTQEIYSFHVDLDNWFDIFYNTKIHDFIERSSKGRWKKCHTLSLSLDKCGNFMLAVLRNMLLQLNMEGFSQDLRQRPPSTSTSSMTFRF